MPRDLAADLRLCEAATPGPWTATRGRFPKVNSAAATLFAAIYGSEADALLAAEARSGWPEAIRRAMAAEARAAELEAQLAKVSEALSDCSKALADVVAEYVDPDPREEGLS